MRTASSFRYAIAAGLALPLVSACQLAGSATASKDEFPPSVAQSVATDMASRFAEQFDPENSQVVLSQDGSSFGQALAASLARAGYTLQNGQDANPKQGKWIELAYRIDLHEGNILATLSARETSLSRAYEISGEGAKPTGSFSIYYRD